MTTPVFYRYDQIFTIHVENWDFSIIHNGKVAARAQSQGDGTWAVSYFGKFHGHIRRKKFTAILALVYDHVNKLLLEGKTNDR